MTHEYFRPALMYNEIDIQWCATWCKTMGRNFTHNNENHIHVALPVCHQLVPTSEIYMIGSCLRIRCSI